MRRGKMFLAYYPGRFYATFIPSWFYKAVFKRESKAKPIEFYEGTPVKLTAWEAFYLKSVSPFTIVQDRESKRYSLEELGEYCKKLDEQTYNRMIEAMEWEL